MELHSFNLFHYPYPKKTEEKIKSFEHNNPFDATMFSDIRLAFLFATVALLPLLYQTFPVKVCDDQVIHDAVVAECNRIEFDPNYVSRCISDGVRLEKELSCPQLQPRTTLDNLISWLTIPLTIFALGRFLSRTMPGFLRTLNIYLEKIIILALLIVDLYAEKSRNSDSYELFRVHRNVIFIHALTLACWIGYLSISRWILDKARAALAPGK